MKHETWGGLSPEEIGIDTEGEEGKEAASEGKEGELDEQTRAEIEEALKKMFDWAERGLEREKGINKHPDPEVYEVWSGRYENFKSALEDLSIGDYRSAIWALEKNPTMEERWERDSYSTKQAPLLREGHTWSEEKQAQKNRELQDKDREVMGLEDKRKGWVELLKKAQEAKQEEAKIDKDKE